MTTATGTAAATGATSDPRPYVRIAAALRRAVTAGAIPPGTRLDQADIAARYHAPARAAIKALTTLKGELVIWHEHRWYAAPAGPPAPAVSTRLGATLTRLRTAAGTTPEDLAAAILSAGFRVYARDIRGAEAGTWQPRHFWAGCDTALGADGTLLRLHDSGYAAPARPRTLGSPDPDPDPAPDSTGEYLPPLPPPGLHPVAARVAAEITGRITAGHWPPGTPLPTHAALAAEHSAGTPFISQALLELAGQGIVTRIPGIGYLTPGQHQAPTRTIIAVLLEWDDGTRTRLACTPAHQPPAPPDGTTAESLP
jgi:DNA-binding GntR family transcriptional regulator